MSRKSLHLQINDILALDKAAAVVQSGGVIAFPTDTVYGIGVSVRDHFAIEKLYQVKGRSKDKSIPILVANSDQLVGITSPPGEIVQEIMASFWPGALTLVLPLLPGLPENLSNTNTIGVRIPDHEFTRKLLHHTGPLAATSANLSGKESSVTALEVEQAFGDKIDLILDGGLSPGGMASTVLDCTSTELVLLRAGPISLDEIREKIS